jgi:hypothetical protein
MLMLFCCCFGASVLLLVVVFIASGSGHPSGDDGDGDGGGGGGGGGGACVRACARAGADVVALHSPVCTLARASYIPGGQSHRAPGPARHERRAGRRARAAGCRTIGAPRAGAQGDCHPLHHGRHHRGRSRAED